MTYKERKRARLMYLFPMMLALTGLALLILEWALNFTDLDALLDFKSLLTHNWYILLLPTALLVLYLIRVQPLGAYIGAGIGGVLFLIQLLVAFLLGVGGGTASGFTALVPGHDLFVCIRTVRAGWTVAAGIGLFANLCLILCNLSAVFSCMYYVRVKNRSDWRQKELLQEEGVEVMLESEPVLED